VTVALIVAGVVVYAWQLLLWLEPRGEPSGAVLYEAVLREFGLVPCRVGAVCPPELESALAGAPGPVLTVLTAMFLHGGLFQLASDLLYLWIFGKSIESAMGHGRFLLFYLLAGGAGAAAHYLQDPGSTIPLVGASGAVSGVLGAYVVLHPFAHVWTLVTFGWFWRMVPVPALVVVGFWVVVQAVSALLTYGRGLAGVAVLAQVAAFLAGAALVPLFLRQVRRTRRRWSRL
jgi:membrane associated rhomboid family serine protease